MCTNFVSKHIVPEQVCNFSEEWTNCGTVCPEHCPVRNAQGMLDDGLNRPCVLMCKIGCQCVKGYVRDLKRNGACVERALCSSP